MGIQSSKIFKVIKDPDKGTVSMHMLLQTSCSSITLPHRHSIPCLPSAPCLFCTDTPFLSSIFLVHISSPIYVLQFPSSNLATCQLVHIHPEAAAAGAGRRSASLGSGTAKTERRTSSTSDECVVTATDKSSSTSASFQNRSWFEGEQRHHLLFLNKFPICP